MSASQPRCHLAEHRSYSDHHGYSKEHFINLAKDYRNFTPQSVCGCECVPCVPQDKTLCAVYTLNIHSISRIQNVNAQDLAVVAVVVDINQIVRRGNVSVSESNL